MNGLAVSVTTSPVAVLGPGGAGGALTHRAGHSSVGTAFPVRKAPCAPFQKIKAVYDTNPAKFRTLQNILEAEKEMYGAEWPKVGATLALMWLKR